MARVTFYESDFNNFFNAPSGPVGQYLLRRGRLVQNAAKRQVGKRTGALRASIHMRHQRDVRGQYVWVGSTLPYALMHHEGTNPHMIFPRSSGHRLVFTTKGRLVFAHAVAHPGTLPNKYLSDNLKLAL